ALDLTDDGAIARWDVCRGGAPQAFAASGERRLGLGVSAEGKPIDMAWDRAEPAPGEWRFRAVDSAHSLEVERAYRRVDANVLEHTLTVTNTSGPALRDVVLTMDPGSALPPDHPATGALADFFYGFQRMLVAHDSGEWRSAELDREVGAFARVARHKTLIVDAVEKLVVVHAAGASARRDSGTQDADPDDASGGLVLALAMPEIEAGETVVFRQKISALPTDIRALAAAGYEGLTYAHLAAPIAWLSAGVERVLSRLAQIAGPGLAVILLAVGVRVVTLPVSLWSARRQSEFSAIAAGMKPKIASVRARYKGAEQSERILGIYKENGVSPFSGLKGSAGLFLQIPFLLAVF